MGTNYIQCGGNRGEQCENKLHEGARINGGGKCRLGRAWEKGAQPCYFCQTLVPKHLGFRPNPGAVGHSFRYRNQQNRSFNVTNFKFGEGGEVRICDECAMTANQAINVDHPEHPGLIDIGNGQTRAVYISVAEMPTPTTVISRIVKRGRVLREEISRKKWEDGVILTECTVHRVAPVLCESPNGEAVVEEMRAVQINSRSLALVCGPCAVQLLKSGKINLLPGTGAEEMSQLLGQPISSGRRDNLIPMTVAENTGELDRTFDFFRAQLSFDTVANGVGHHPTHGKPGGRRPAASCGAKKAGRKCGKQKKSGVAGR